MTVSQWEPSDAEIDAAVRATDGYLTSAEAEAVLQDVSPLIAARALREAANGIRAEYRKANFLTTASENADHYAGFDAGILRATQFLRARAESVSRGAPKGDTA